MVLHLSPRRGKAPICRAARRPPVRPRPRPVAAARSPRSRTTPAAASPTAASPPSTASSAAAARGWCLTPTRTTSTVTACPTASRRSTTRIAAPGRRTTTTATICAAAPAPSEARPRPGARPGSAARPPPFPPVPPPARPCVPDPAPTPQRMHTHNNPSSLLALPYIKSFQKAATAAHFFELISILACCNNAPSRVSFPPSCVLTWYLPCDILPNIVCVRHYTRDEEQQHNTTRGGISGAIGSVQRWWVGLTAAGTGAPARRPSASKGAARLELPACSGQPSKAWTGSGGGLLRVDLVAGEGPRARPLLNQAQPFVLGLGRIRAAAVGVGAKRGCGGGRAGRAPGGWVEHGACDAHLHTDTQAWASRMGCNARQPGPSQEAPPAPLTPGRGHAVDCERHRVAISKGLRLERGVGEAICGRADEQPLCTAHAGAWPPLPCGRITAPACSRPTRPFPTQLAQAGASYFPT